jgi:hypothetical protein
MAMPPRCLFRMRSFQDVRHSPCCKPGGAFVGCDSLQSVFMRVLHLGDTFVPIRPDTFGARLEGAGFEVIELEKGPGAFRFYAIKPMRRA